jgi:hypothetical protein
VPPQDIEFVGASLVILLRPWQNPDNRFDVNNDGYFSPLDILLDINEINGPQWSDGSGNLPLPPPPGPFPFFDINGDNRVDAADVLMGINELNRCALGGGGEGEWYGAAGAAGWLFGSPASAAATTSPAAGLHSLAGPDLAWSSAPELVYPALDRQGDLLAAAEQSEADRMRAAQLAGMGSWADEDSWGELVPFELEETLDLIGEDIRLALAR